MSNSAVDTLELDRAGALVAVRVNGVDLRVVVMDALRPTLSAEHAAGRRGSGSLESLLNPEWYTAYLARAVVEPPSRHWLGTPTPGYAEDGRAAVLTCTCDHFGCGGVTAKIDFSNGFVVWRDFHEAGGGPTLPIGRYKFDLTAYQREIQSLPY